MSRLTGLRVLVAGAGAVGAATALRLLQDGARVVLVDPAPFGDNASGVAAGMLAPAFEAALDPVSTDHFELLRTARDRWAALTAALAQAVGLDRSGALWVGDAASQAAMHAKLDGLGAEASRRGREAAEGASPGLCAPEGAVFTTEDWRLDAGRALRAFRAAVLEQGGEVRGTALRTLEPAVEGVDAIVLATGLAPDHLRAELPEAGLLSPIKGQIMRVAGLGPTGGPAVRAEGIYISPSAAGPAIGATMEPGRADRQVDPAAVERLLAKAGTLFPALQGAQGTGAAGVRAATPDGLPMVGPSRADGVILALGARRNGWLLALDMAEAAAACLAGRPPPPAYDPARFA